MVTRYLHHERLVLLGREVITGKKVEDDLERKTNHLTGNSKTVLRRFDALPNVLGRNMHFLEIIIAL